jgi:hypothetical protein
MKRAYIFTLLFLTFCGNLFAQKQKQGEMASPQALHDQYVQQANNRQMMGYVLLTGGVALTVGGIAKMKAPSFQNVSKGDPRLLWLPVVGILSTAASFPMMKSSRKLREKAVMALDDESAFIGNQRVPFQSYPALRLTIPL